MAPRKPPKDPAARNPEWVDDAQATTERAMNSGFGKVKASELYSAIAVPPGPTTVNNSRKPGSNLPGGVEVAHEVNGAAHRIADKLGQADQEFPTIGASAVLGNVLHHDQMMADVHVQLTAAGDPPVVVHPHDDNGEIPPAWRPAIVYSTSNVKPDGRAPQTTVVEDV